MFRLSIVALILFYPSIVFSQVGKETGFWEWTQAAEHHKSIVKITSTNGVVEHGGTGTVIGEFKIITAYHVVDEEFSHYADINGKLIQLSITHFDAIADVCVLKANEKINLPMIKVADNIPKESEEIEVCGFGGGGALRHFKGDLKLYSTSFIGVDAYVISGDSGGPILNNENELIGIVSGGMAWSTEKKISHENRSVSITWPIRCGSLEVIKTMVSK